MKIAILTLPLLTNYGGILQAYALQTVLERMGHEVEHLQPLMEYKSLHPFWILPFVWCKRLYRKYVKGDKILPIFENPHKLVRKNTDVFISSNIKIRGLKFSEWIKANIQTYDVVVFGSDQIWRPIYANPIERYFGDFIESNRTKKIAFAASFGTDENEYTSEQMQKCASLLKTFIAVSVRELSAVSIAQERFGIKAEHVLDPTMLLKVTDYINLFIKAKTPKSQGTLAVYVLDENLGVNDCIKMVSHTKSLIPFQINSKIENHCAPLIERIHLSVEQWLRAFYDAEFVVTDSFHACVFSIIFNKPFICMGNKNRGNARFNSLLKMFGLENRIVNEDSLLENIINTSIDWGRVNKILDQNRRKTISFLENSLSL